MTPAKLAYNIVTNYLYDPCCARATKEVREDTNIKGIFEVIIVTAVTTSSPTTEITVTKAIDNVIEQNIWRHTRQEVSLHGIKIAIILNALKVSSYDVLLAM